MEARVKVSEELSDNQIGVGPGQRAVGSPCVEASLEARQGCHYVGNEIDGCAGSTRNRESESLELLLKSKKGERTVWLSG